MSRSGGQARKREDVGLSSSRLERSAAACRADVDMGAIPGAEVLIARNGIFTSLSSQRSCAT
jgi:hypothetical protein